MSANLAAMGSVGTLWSIVDLLSSSTAAVEWKLWISATDGDPENRTEVKSHRVLDLLRRPNPFFTRQLLFETCQQHIELCGECWLVVVKNAVGWPAQLWPVRPDRMRVVPDPDEFIAGYEYLGPDGEVVPLEVDQVLSIKTPNPYDAYRGLGPVQSILLDAGLIRTATFWNGQFFENGAEPGGIIELDSTMSDPEFDTFRRRWNEGHRGAANAHRVGLLEKGKWKDRAFSHKDMEFAELINVSKQSVREAFAIHPHMLGIAEDVNRANADAADVTFARRKTIPRLGRWRDLLNYDLLPMYDDPRALELDFVDPVKEDEAGQAQTFFVRSQGVALLVPLGYDPEMALAASGLPEMDFEKPAPPPAPIVPGGTGEPGAGDDGAVPPENGGTGPRDYRRAPRAALVDPTTIDLTHVQDAWQRSLDTLVTTWTEEVTPRQVKSLHAQIKKAIDARPTDEVGDLDQVQPDPQGQELLTAAMSSLAGVAGGQVAQEAAAQGVTVDPATADAAQLAGWATVTEAILAAGLRLSAIREAMRVATPEMTGEQVADRVVQYLEAMPTRALRDQLGGALTAAQNAGRLATFADGPECALYASEQLDKNTCKPCRAVDGRWLGNASDMAQVESMYPSSGYVDCEGRERCRGTVVGVWRPETVGTGGDE